MIRQAPRSLVFFHIPKCGGTSVTAALRSVFPDAVTDAGNLSAASLGSRPHADGILFHGHAEHGAAWHVPRGAVTATMLRTPVDQAISNYSHLRRSPELPLHELACELGFAGLMRNHWPLLVFQAISLDVMISDEPIRTPDMLFDRLPAIHRLLHRIDVVGRLERLPAFLRKVARRTGRSQPRLGERLNVTDRDAAGLDVASMRQQYHALQAEPLLQRLMAAESALVDIADAKARSKLAVCVLPVGRRRHWSPAG